MRGLFKGVALSILQASGELARARRRTRRQARILAYHGVDADVPGVVNFDGFHVAPDVFRAQLERLTRHFRVLPLDELVDGLAGRRALPDGAAAITFDDGYRNNLDHAAPVLMELGLPATFFVTIDFIDRTRSPWWFVLRAAVEGTCVPILHAGGEDPLSVSGAAAKQQAVVKLEARLKSLPAEERDRRLNDLIQESGAGRTDDPYPMMTWEEVRRLAALGFRVGPHTMTHPSLAQEDEDRAAAEVQESVERVRRETGQSPAVFSFPYGRVEDLSPAALEAVRRSGCRAALTTSSGLNAGGVDLYRLRRLNVTGRHQGLAFDALAAGVTK